METSMIATHRPWRRLRVGCRAACRVACAVLAAAALQAHAQAYPSGRTTLVMPIAPSLAFSVAIRQMADQIQQKTGQPIIFDYVIGADGTLAPPHVKRAKPDGYTIGLTYANPMTVNPYVDKEPRYDPLKDFAYISMLTRHGVLYVAGNNFAANTIQELVAMAKARPNTVKVASAGLSARLWILQLEDAAGIRFFEVPYKSGADYAVALMAGDADIAGSTVGSQIGLIKGGKLKPLFIGSRKRSPMLPDTPSITEVYPNAEMISWYALYAPAGTPQDRIDRLYREWTAAVKDPQMVEKMQTVFGYEVVASTPQELVDQIKREIPITQRLAKDRNLSE
jgi:tripartite-type tricarboxylate transporter receptor subunit TctC